MALRMALTSVVLTLHFAMGQNVLVQVTGVEIDRKQEE